MTDTTTSRLSLKQLLTIPYVVLILTLALIIGGLSYFAGSRAVEAVSDHLLHETVGRISQATDRHIVGSGAVLEAAFPDGMPVATDLETEIKALRTRFWIATSLHLDPNNFVYFGNRMGQALGLYRHSRSEGELRMKLKPEDPRAFYQFTGIDGALTLKSRETKIFDPRTRPWYKAGQSESIHTWTSVYIDFSTQELVATRARRVVGAEGQFEGVVATDVSLRALNDFVGNLKMSPNGIALIVEPGGDLIASSASPNVRAQTDGAMGRVSAAESGNPLVAALDAEVRTRMAARSKGPRNLNGATTFNFTGPDGRVIHAAFDRLKDDAGLDWIIVVAMPRSDFMTGVSENVLITIVFSALAAVLAIALGLRILYVLAADLKQLSDATVQVGNGKLNWPLGVRRPDEIGELAKNFEIMQQRLQTDSLTTLPNREAFMLRLRGQIADKSGAPEAGRFAVLFIDLNRFKAINDKYGHSLGDEVLIEVGARLKKAVRANDLVARLSGDEFVVLLDNIEDSADLERVRRQIHITLQEPLQCLAKVGVKIDDFGGSVGESMYPDDGRTAESLLKKADRRMYNQKFADQDDMPDGMTRRASD
jgi:diguanylate cyclase (GGDEF)-like protein